MSSLLLMDRASSGFGEAIAYEALSRGHQVIATARSASKLGKIKGAGAAVLDLDVTSDEEKLAAVFKEANAIYGRITHVVNCAGYLLEGAVEEASNKEVFDTFNTNVFGTANVARAAAPYLREAAKVPGGQAALATFGSLGSWESGPAAAYYCSTKFAVSGLTEGLAEELRPFGITVCCFEPGYTRTGFLASGAGGDHRIKTARQIELYHNTGAEEMRKAMDAYNGNQPGDVVKCAKVIVDVLTKEGVAKGREIPVRLPLGSDCLGVVRHKCESALKLVKEWEEVISSTMH
ncbi:NAD(P)-binding protein [Parathielavia appendiculata]|uniref:NAD(P)-binding protein n=1 Tax=Parathielavia appendiculata TaxID=2587402 RepID=A0AAN6Z9A4_9PEZI|nr:NAD(P)-binding protein [Parathielavia appendiculata]